MKGGAAGGGYAQVVPMEDINLHFTGDFHAITSAHNLLSAMIDNHIYWGNELGIDTRRVAWRRVMDMNDRALREIVCSLGGVANGYPARGRLRHHGRLRDHGDPLPVDLDRRPRAPLGQIVVAAKRDKSRSCAKDLKAPGAMTVLLKDALQPNLVQTLENNPAFVHGGPFANIAHGCNSVMATKTALKLADYVVTEAGFGADLGAEKFFDIKCRKAGLTPAAAVIVATVRALKMHGGVAKDDLKAENVEALQEGLRQSRPPYREREEVRRADRGGDQPLHLRHRRRDRGGAATTARSHGVEAILCTHWARGRQGHRGAGQARGGARRQGRRAVRADLCRRACRCGTRSRPSPSEIYRADDVVADKSVRDQLKACEAAGLWQFPDLHGQDAVFLLDRPESASGAPTGHVVPIREVRLSAGAGFIVVICGDIMTMPGLPKVPSAEVIGLDEKGQIDGLF